MGICCCAGDVTRRGSCPYHARTMSTTLFASPFTPRAAYALRAFFALLGVVSGTWMALIPGFRLQWGLGLEALGWVLLSIGVGSVSAYPLAHWGLPRFGSARMCAFSATGLAGAVVLVAMAPSLTVAVLGLFAFGLSAGLMDSAINTQAVTQEAASGRALMAGMHGFYSLGNLIAGAWVSLTVAWGWHLPQVLGGVGAAGLALPWVLQMGLLREAKGEPVGAAAEAAVGGARAVPWSRALLLLGALIVAAYLVEGASLDWGGVYLRQHAGASLAQAPWAFTAFSATMVVGRFLGDRVIQAWGAHVTLQRGGLLAMAGLSLALLWPRLEVVVVAFAVLGLGLSVVVPVLFSLAGRLNPGDGGRTVALVAMMGYAGVLSGPAVIGWIAERAGLPSALALLVLLAALIWRQGPRAGRKSAG